MRAAYCPVDENADEATVKAYRSAAENNDIVISEVGAWHCSLLHENSEMRERAYAYCARRLRLADKIGARCCVSVAGSRGGDWDSPHPDNLSDETFQLLVETMQKLLDEVRPVSACYTIEAMPWMYPDSTDSYEALLKAVDRRQFGVHYDPVNMITSHHKYFHNGDVIADFVRRLGDRICSCHLKDVSMENRYNISILEKKPGEGGLDYAALLPALNGLNPELTVMTEHLSNEEENVRAEHYIRSQAKNLGIPL
ncbi:MAG: sugar phosphate isomerase/epimerase family protein [Acetanaerobacterium sp.]